ncbi:Ankyrin repeat domain-containing protein 53 [Liparis tanakae]|uniref:Ankyrin repeat domain-containing protein 53 n=1 Tax=Liparis tanakae TaxID=230148 RepID=A0A4Z2FX04_9TELE|nr:Ankyrin repeat domain-containing protein 53 [Liparis tanakae]
MSGRSFSRVTAIVYRERRDRDTIRNRSPLDLTTCMSSVSFMNSEQSAVRMRIAVPQPLIVNGVMRHTLPPDRHTLPPDRHTLLAAAVRSPEPLDDRQAEVQLLAESRPGWEWIDSGDLLGRRPVHMVLSTRSSPNTSSCLAYLVELGADVNATSDTGTTPLHLAASEGLLDCAETLVRAGADVWAQDSVGHTPLDLAHIWCHRKMARYLKNWMWQSGKKKEMQQRKLVQRLYGDLVGEVKLNRLNKKEFSPSVSASQYHTKCLSSVQDQSASAGRPPPASPSRPWTVFTGGLQPEGPPREPDLRGGVSVWRDSSGGVRPLYSTQWGGSHRPAPDVSLDVLERVLFPRAFPPRIASLRHFEPRDIGEVQRRGHPQGRSTSPWTEVAMHLPEVLEPGHY